MSDSANTVLVEPEVYARVFIAEASDEIALATEIRGDPPKRWAIDSGCTNHFSPYESDFVSYKPYDMPGNIRVGDARSIPSLIQDVQYVPDLTYGLLSCKVLNRKGLSVLMEDGACTIRLKDGTPVGESSRVGRLYFLNTLPSPAPETDPTHTNRPVEPIALTVSPSFDLIHKRLAHPGKDTQKHRTTSTVRRASRER